jgi:hypothetical protein
VVKNIRSHGETFSKVMEVEFAESHVAGGTGILSFIGNHFESFLAFEKNEKHEFGGSDISGEIIFPYAEKHAQLLCVL